mgnify:FL=1
MPISSNNSSQVPLLSNASFTGSWISVDYNVASISVSGNASHKGTLYAEFSSTSDNISDRTLKLSSGETINFGVHLLSPVMKFFRVRLVNGDTDQTSLDLQTITSPYNRVSLPTSRAGGDFNAYSDCLDTKPVTNLVDQIALGKHEDAAIWNIYGRNTDIDDAEEVIANFGGTFLPLSVASTIRITSTDVTDTFGGVACKSIQVSGIDAYRKAVVENFQMAGTSSVTSGSTWLGINNVKILSCGTAQVNAGTIRIVATSDSSEQGGIPIGSGTSQQVIYHTPVDTTSLISYIQLKANKQSGGSPIVEFKLFSFNHITNCRIEEFDFIMDTSIENTLTIDLPNPLVISGSSTTYITASTDRDNTICSARLSFTNYSVF